MSHGIVGSFGDDAWTSRVRTPPLYPDAVTLQPAADVRSVLSRIDDRPGCSVKDSFDRLALEPHGFRPLLRGSWFALLPERSPGWREVVPPELPAWERAWSGAEPTSFFRPSLLDDTAVRMLARFEDAEIVAGAIANRAAGVTGLTNVFGDDAWSGAAAFVGGPVVCWETEAPAGSTRLGDLTVWILD
jgi:hypothetical protein